MDHLQLIPRIWLVSYLFSANECDVMRRYIETSWQSIYRVTITISDIIANCLIWVEVNNIPLINSCPLTYFSTNAILYYASCLILQLWSFKYENLEHETHLYNFLALFVCTCYIQDNLTTAKHSQDILVAEIREGRPELWWETNVGFIPVHTHSYQCH